MFEVKASIVKCLLFLTILDISLLQLANLDSEEEK